MIVCTKYLPTGCLHMCICLHHHAGPFGLSHSYNRTPLLFQLLSCQWGCFLVSVLRHKANPTLPHQSGVTHATLLTLLEGFYTNSIKFPYHCVSLCKHAYQFQCGSSHARHSLAAHAGCCVLCPETQHMHRKLVHVSCWLGMQYVHVCAFLPIFPCSMFTVIGQSMLDSVVVITSYQIMDISLYLWLLAGVVYLRLHLH